MADNVTVDNGTLTDYVVSADEGAGGLVQRTKLAYSADGSEIHVQADADGLLVNLGANNDVTVTGAVLSAIEDDTTNIAIAAATLAGAVSGTEMQVDVVTMPTVTISDGGGSLTVDGTVTATVGTVTAVTTVGTITNVVHVDDNASTLSVDDGGGSLTVDGTVAVTDNSGSLTIDAPVGTPAFVRLSDGTSAIATLPVSLASVPSHAVTNAGTFVTQENGAALTALQLIDNPVVVDDAAFTPASTSVMMAGFEYDDTTPDSVNEGDAGAARMSANRNQYVQIRDNAGNERGLNIDASGFIGVTDGGGSLTVDGTVAATQSGTWNITNVSGTVSLPTGAATAAKQPALGTAGTASSDVITVQGIASGTALPVSDNGSSLTVDNAGTFSVQASSVIPGTGATNLGKAADSVAGATDTGVAPLFIRDDALSAITPAEGDWAPGRVDANGAQWVSISSGSVTASGTIDVDGTVAHDAADSGDPVKVGFKAVNALPTAVANGDRANGLADLFGRMLVAGLDPAMQVSKTVNVTTTQTGTDVWSPASGKRIAVTDITISAYGTTAGRVILWFGDNADTTYTAGTDQVLETASFAPSATVKSGLAKVYGALNPVFCTTADRELHLTTDAAMSLDITLRGYEW